MVDPGVGAMLKYAQSMHTDFLRNNRFTCKFFTGVCVVTGNRRGDPSLALAASCQPSHLENFHAAATHACG